MVCLCAEEYWCCGCSHPHRPEDSFERDMQSSHGHLARLGKTSKIPGASPVLITDLKHPERNFCSHQVLPSDQSLSQLRCEHSTKDTAILHQKSDYQSFVLDLA